MTGISRNCSSARMRSVSSNPVMRGMSTSATTRSHSLLVQALERLDAVARDFRLVSGGKQNVLLQLAGDQRVVHHQHAADARRGAARQRRSGARRRRARREIEQRVDVENRHDVAVAEQRRAGERLLIAQRSAQLLEHELLLFVHGLDEDAEPAVAALGDDDGLARGRRRRRHLQHRRERRQRNVFAVDFGHRALLELSDVAGARPEECGGWRPSAARTALRPPRAARRAAARATAAGSA